MKGYELYIFPLLVSFAISLFVSLVLVVFFKFKVKKSFDSRKGERHIQNVGVSRFGGIAMIVAFIATIFFDKNLVISNQIFAILFGVVILLGIGLWDDIREMNWKKQLFFQFMVIVCVFFLGVRIEYINNPFGGMILLNTGKLAIFFGFVIMAIWTVLLMNAMNWIDGIDGSFGGIAIIGALTIFLLSLKPEVNQPPVAIIAVALLGCLAGFLLLNFHPARIMAGTSGAVFVGFVLAMLSIFAGAKIATTLLVMIIPIIDAFWVVFERFRSGRSIFQPDRRHLHHKLLELGWSQLQICFLFYAVTLIVAFAALNSRAIGKISLFFLAVVLLISFLLFVRKQIGKTQKQIC